LTFGDLWIAWRRLALMAERGIERKVMVARGCALEVKGMVVGEDV